VGAKLDPTIITGFAPTRYREVVLTVSKLLAQGSGSGGV